MRLFTGISLAYEVRRNVELLYQSLQPLAAVEWSPPENLHITTKFIGEWPEERLEELRGALRGVKVGRIELSVDGFGWFPTPHHPRHLFAAVRSGEIAGLAAETEAALLPLGVAAETKPYRPHLPLARIQDPQLDLAPVKQFIAQLPSTDFGRMTAASFKLYASRNRVYTVVEDFPL